MKLENALKKLKNEGAEITVIKERYYTAQFEKCKIEFIPSRDDEVFSWYVMDNGSEDEVESDYFTGVWFDALSRAIKFIRR